MKIVSVIGVVAVSVLLSGCTTGEIIDQTQRTCKWVPTVNLVTKSVTALTGLPPGVGVGIEVGQAVVAAICEAAAKQKPGRSLPLVAIGTKRLPLEGYRAP